MTNFIDKQALCLLIGLIASLAGCGAAATSSMMPESELTTMAAGTARTWLTTVAPCTDEHADWLEAEVLTSAPCTRLDCDYQCCNWCQGEMLARITARSPSPSVQTRDIQSRLIEELGTSQLECELTAVNQVIRNVRYRVNPVSWTGDPLLTTEDLCQMAAP